MLYNTNTKEYAKNSRYKIKWERENLPIRSFPEFIYKIFFDGYQENQQVRYDAAKSFYKVDYVHLSHKHIIEFSGKHHTTKLGVQRTTSRDRNLESAGWHVTRIPF